MTELEILKEWIDIELKELSYKVFENLSCSNKFDRGFFKGQRDAYIECIIRINEMLGGK